MNNKANIDTKAVYNLASQILKESAKFLKESDRKYSAQMNKLFQNSSDKSILIDIVDRAFRTKSSAATAKIIRSSLRGGGLSFLSPIEKFAMKCFIVLSPIFHFILVPLFRWYVYVISSRYVLFGNEDSLNKRIISNTKRGLRTNLNRVGELLLGEDDARHRVKKYCEDLRNPNIKCISIKISTIFSQINSLDFDATVEKITEAAIEIYNVALENSYFEPTLNRKVSKIVNFDMEEYRDMPLTVAVFKAALSRPELKNVHAGLALQAYLPDSYLALQEVIEFAKQRVSNGGSPLRVRIVKGANMDMELFEAHERHWHLAPFGHKESTDANYKKMLRLAFIPENIEALNIGVASHNLFDISYAYLLAKEYGSLQYITFEMLSGMSEHISMTLAKNYNLNVLLYLPYSTKQDFISSIGYLVRRFDENTNPSNYLRYIHELSTGVNRNWDYLYQSFQRSLTKEIDNMPHRLQNRFHEFTPESPNEYSSLHLGNYKAAVDTDFTLKNNARWAEKIREKYKDIKDILVPACIGGEFLKSEGSLMPLKSHDSEVEIGKIYSPTPDDADVALKTAKTFKDWQNMHYKQRLEVISQAIMHIRQRRGDIMAVMALNTGKSFLESDVEITEAIDFGEYYSHCYMDFVNKYGELFTPKGTCLVISPWNFPFAIPSGGIFAGLIAGNNVIFKPSNFAGYVGYEIVKCFYDAGVPHSALQFVPSVNSQAAVRLTSSRDVDITIFTGGTQTALNIISKNPYTPISAETGGKNVTIVTKYADRDQAIKNVLHSAFSNAGQKCSATSILALESEIYNDHKFLENLVDAAKSMTVGNAFNFATRINSLIRKPLSELSDALTKLDDEEKWLLKPQLLSENGKLWSPGIKIGVKFGSKSHTTEFFGPVLSVMKIKNIHDGIKLVNHTGYGLTSGLESLSEEEQKIWSKSIRAGNLYINRSTTGAVVERQPFGGMGKSAYGCGTKAGGVNYILQFCNIKNEIQHAVKSEYMIDGLDITGIDLSIVKSYIHNYHSYFEKEIDYVNVSGQSNITRFVEAEDLMIYVGPRAKPHDITCALLSAHLCARHAYISVDHSVKDIVLSLPAEITSHLRIHFETRNIMMDHITSHKRIRSVSIDDIDDAMIQRSAINGTFIVRNPIMLNGRFELLNYLQEQSVSTNYHRYGYIKS